MVAPAVRWTRALIARVIYHLRRNDWLRPAAPSGEKADDGACGPGYIRREPGVPIPKLA